MITKNDCLSILVKLEDSGVEGVDPYIKKLLISREAPIEVLKFISDNRGIEVGNFYEMLRKSHNQKKSPLYTNILKEIEDKEEIITTLSCLLTQIILYGNKLPDREKDLFFKEVRAEEITRVLDTYFETGIYEDCKTLLGLIKSDLLVLEYIAGRRELAI
jgi:hypothetical protein